MTTAAISPSHTVLQKFWERTLNPSAHVKATHAEWHDTDYHLSLTGMGMEETLHYLYYRRPSFDEFLEWTRSSYVPGTPVIDAGEPVLTPEDHARWDRDGYLVVKNIISSQHCEAARQAIWNLLEADVKDPATWYRHDQKKRGMMLAFFQHAALETNRRNPRIRRVYEELYNAKDLYLPVDKVSFNPPVSSVYNFSGSPLHWDVSLHLPVPYKLQGLLYLTDVKSDEGAFHCVPGFHREIGSWLDSLPAGADPREMAPQMLKPVPVPGNAGDLVIWNQALPHCATPNLGIEPRLVQYIAYKPIGVLDSEVWK